LLLRISSRVVTITRGGEPNVLYVNTTDGTFDHIPMSKLPPIPTTESSSVVRYVALSDTHLLHGDIVLPPGSVLIHCGDILVEDRGYYGSTSTNSKWKTLLEDFNEWLGYYRDMFEYRLVTGGNHDQILQDLGTKSVKKLLSNGTYMNGESIFLNFTNISGEDTSSHHIYASAASRGYTTKRRRGGRVTDSRGGATDMTTGGNTAFQYTSDEAAEDVWTKVPSSRVVDVLVTHGPPNGIFDGAGSSAGCPVLRRHVQENIKPRVHVFGHWHDDPGSTKVGETVYINAATVDFDYSASNSPVVFDLSLS